MAKIRLALVYGGASGEHSVSCLTAASVMRAIDREKYELIPLAIRQDGTWVPGENDPGVLEAAGPQGVVPPSDCEILPSTSGRGEFLVRDATGACSHYATADVVFPLLHGPFGEDGTIQGMLEMLRLPYVGSGVFASAAGMDKHYMKVVLEAANIPVAPYVLVTARRWELQREEILAEVEERLVYPVFVKPARAGSSLGITKVESADGLEAAVEYAQKTDPKVLIEQGVKGREIECAVLGGHGTDRPRASILGEIALDMEPGAWYDYSTKYIQTEGFHMDIPATIDEAIALRMREMALDVYEAFECEGMTRVDFFLCEDGSVIVNEHNTIPGFTAFSMYPVLWQETGISYTELIDELVSLACERPLGLR